MFRDIDERRLKVVASYKAARGTCCGLIVFLSFFSYGQDVSPTAVGVSTKSESGGELTAGKPTDSQAELRVARAYYEGIGESQNYRKAAQWFEMAWKHGSPEAGAWLGSCYLYGRGVPQDLVRANSLIQAAADSNDPVGLRFLGVMSQDAMGVPLDYSKANALFSKAAAMQDAYSFDQLGIQYLRGLGVKKDVRRAVRLFTRGARLGDSWSQLNLGELYQSGHVPHERPGVKSPATPDYKMALGLYNDSAAQGNRVAAYKLGQMYELGVGTKRDYEKALGYYRQSAVHQYAPAQIALGRLTEYGLGTQVNLVYAYVWYGLANDQGNAYAGERFSSLGGKLNLEQVREADALLSQLEISKP
jgi:TPR repeat protein